MHDIKGSRGGHDPQGARMKGTEATKDKGKDKARIETSVGERQNSHRTHRRVQLERDSTDQCLHQPDLA